MRAVDFEEIEVYSKDGFDLVVGKIDDDKVNVLISFFLFLVEDVKYLK